MVTGRRVDVGEMLEALEGWYEVEALLDPPTLPRFPPTRPQRWRRQVDNQRLLMRAMRHERPRIRSLAALVGSGLQPVVTKALEDPMGVVRAAGATSPVAPLHLLVRLVDDPYRNARYELARNERTPLSALVRLIDDPDREIRVVTAGHPGFPPSLLSELVFYPDWRVVDAVVDNPAATPEVLDLVSSREGDDPTVTAWLASRVTERLASRVLQV